MIIIFHRDDFLHTLFPGTDIKMSTDSLIEHLKGHYSFGPFQPKVWIVDGIVHIEIDDNEITQNKKEYDAVIALCNAGNFDPALPRLKKLIKNNPTVSEYHRVLAQIYDEQKKYELAIESLHESLRWNPSNVEALILLANVHLRHNNDTKLAMSLYEKALSISPDNHIAITNIGHLFFEENKLAEAHQYFSAALSIQPDYVNALMGELIILKAAKMPLEAFDTGVTILKNHSRNQAPYQHAFKVMHDIAQKYSLEYSGKDTITKFSKLITEDCGVPIRLEPDEKLETAARLEVAEFKGRDYHRVAYNKDLGQSAHLIMHELWHLRMVINARTQNTHGNFVFVNGEEHINKFNKDNTRTSDLLRSSNMSPEVISGFLDSVFKGINSQLYNAPLDLLIEKHIHEDNEDLRPIQFLSLFQIISAGIQAVTMSESMYIPPRILSASKVLNLIAALQFKELFGLDLISKFQADRDQVKLAESFYADFNEMLKNYKPGKEYELVLNWSVPLKLRSYFELIPEETYFREKDLDSFMQTLRNLSSAPPDESLNHGSNEDASPLMQDAITVYCFDALRKFSSMSPEEIKNIGVEIALLGQHGINPNDLNQKRHLASISGRTFNNLELLAYMFVAWQHIDPSQNLGLSYHKEYENAKKMFELLG